MQASITEPSGTARSVLARILRGRLYAGLIGFDRVEGREELGAAGMTDLLMLFVSFFGGWFLGIIGGSPDDKLP